MESAAVMGQIFKFLTGPETATQLDCGKRMLFSTAGGEFVRVANYWTNLVSSILHRVTTHLSILAGNLVISDHYIAGSFGAFEMLIKFPNRGFWHSD